jgi:hypothetical protein
MTAARERRLKHLVAEPSLNGRKRASCKAHLILGITMANDSDERAAALRGQIRVAIRMPPTQRLSAI